MYDLLYDLWKPANKISDCSHRIVTHPHCESWSWCRPTSATRQWINTVHIPNFHFQMLNVIINPWHHNKVKVLTCWHKMAPLDWLHKPNTSTTNSSHLKKLSNFPNLQLSSLQLSDYKHDTLTVLLSSVSLLWFTRTLLKCILHSSLCSKLPVQWMTWNLLCIQFWVLSCLHY